MVFTTQIWDITEITQPRLKTAGKQLRAWDQVDKKKVAAPKNSQKTAIGLLSQKETQQLYETAEKQLRTHDSRWREK